MTNRQTHRQAQPFTVEDIAPLFHLQDDDYYDDQDDDDYNDDDNEDDNDDSSSRPNCLRRAGSPTSRFSARGWSSGDDHDHDHDDDDGVQGAQGGAGAQEPCPDDRHGQGGGQAHVGQRRGQQHHAGQRRV